MIAKIVVVDGEALRDMRSLWKALILGQSDRSGSDTRMLIVIKGKEGMRSERNGGDDRAFI